MAGQTRCPSSKLHSTAPIPLSKGLENPSGTIDYIHEHNDVGRARNNRVDPRLEKHPLQADTHRMDFPEKKSRTQRPRQFEQQNDSSRTPSQDGTQTPKQPVLDSWREFQRTEMDITSIAVGVWHVASEWRGESTGKEKWLTTQVRISRGLENRRAL